MINWSAVFENVGRLLGLEWSARDGMWRGTIGGRPVFVVAGPPWREVEVCSDGCTPVRITEFLAERDHLDREVVLRAFVAEYSMAPRRYFYPTQRRYVSPMLGG